MTREEAVIILDGFKNNPLFNDTHLQAFNMAISALSESNGEWIPVSEKLPSDYGHDWVLAQIQEDNGYLWIPCVAEYRKLFDDWFSEANEVGWLSVHKGAFKVVAWQPLPEPYKAEKGGEE